MWQINFQGVHWLPSGPRDLHHPRMYSEVDGVIVCDEYSDELTNDGGARTEDTWLTVAGLDRYEQHYIKCPRCGAEGHVAKDCHLLVNQLARRQSVVKGKGKK